MKRIVLALALAIGLAAPAIAANLDYTACTLDHVWSALSLEMAPDTPTDVRDHIAQVFKDAAKQMTEADLEDTPGYVAFINGLSETDEDYIVAINRKPHAIGQCAAAE